MMSEVSALHGVLKAVSEFLEKDSSRVSVIPEDTIASCMVTLHGIMAIIQKFRTNSMPLFGASHIRWLRYKEKFQILKNDLDRHKATFSVVLSGYAR
jgi:hypothetical protein